MVTTMKANGDVLYDPAKLDPSSIAIVAEVEGNAKSVFLKIPGIKGTTDNDGMPFTLFGSQGYDMKPGSLEANKWYKAVGKPYPETNRKGTVGKVLKVNFRLVPQKKKQASKVTKLNIINAKTDTVMKTLSNGKNYIKKGPSLNVQAVTEGPISKVVFSGFASSTESQAPYALFGDNKGDYNPRWITFDTSHTLIATPYDANGNPGPAFKRVFQLKAQ